MKKFIVIIFLFVLSCTGKTDECGKNEVLDKRFRTLPSKTMALCIQAVCNETDDACCSGVIKDGECLSEVSPGEKCGIISDCGKEAPICLSDPMIVETFIEKGAEIGIELNAHDLVSFFGLNYCTVINCDSNPEKPFDKDKPVLCPEKMFCSDDLAGIKTGVFICKPEGEKEEIPDESEIPDNNDEIIDEQEHDDVDIEPEYACMGDSCSNHADCKKEICAATFCTAELGMFLPEGAPEVCVLRCNPSDGDSACPEGLVCNGQVSMLGDAADGAKGICVTPEVVFYSGGVL